MNKQYFLLNGALLWTLNNKQQYAIGYYGWRLHSMIDHRKQLSTDQYMTLYNYSKIHGLTNIEERRYGKKS